MGKIEKHNYFTRIHLLGFVIDWYHGKAGAIGFEMSRPKELGYGTPFVEWLVLSVRLWPNPGMRTRKSGRPSNSRFNGKRVNHG